MDIVERLRKDARGPALEAADEIERLREALQKIMDKNPFKHNVTPTRDLNYYPMLVAEMVAIASAALERDE